MEKWQSYCKSWTKLNEIVIRIINRIKNREKVISDHWSWSGRESPALGLSKYVHLLMFRCLTYNDWRHLAPIKLIHYCTLNSLTLLIGRKRTVNFRNRPSWRHNCRLCNNHVKDTRGHVVFATWTNPWKFSSSFTMRPLQHFPVI